MRFARERCAMNKFFLRIFAILLIPCLLSDATAESFLPSQNSLRSSSHTSFCRRFEQEALAPVAVNGRQTIFERHPPFLSIPSGSPGAWAGFWKAIDPKATMEDIVIEGGLAEGSLPGIVILFSQGSIYGLIAFVVANMAIHYKSGIFLFDFKIGNWRAVRPGEPGFRWRAYIAANGVSDLAALAGFLALRFGSPEMIALLIPMLFHPVLSWLTIKWTAVVGRVSEQEKTLPGRQEVDAAGTMENPESLNLESYRTIYEALKYFIPEEFLISSQRKDPQAFIRALATFSLKHADRRREEKPIVFERRKQETIQLRYTLLEDLLTFHTENPAVGFGKEAIMDGWDASPEAVANILDAPALPVGKIKVRLYSPYDELLGWDRLRKALGKRTLEFADGLPNLLRYRLTFIELSQENSLGLKVMQDIFDHDIRSLGSLLKIVYENHDLFFKEMSDDNNIGLPALREAAPAHPNTFARLVNVLSDDDQKHKLYTVVLEDLNWEGIRGRVRTNPDELIQQILKGHKHVTLFAVVQRMVERWVFQDLHEELLDLKTIKYPNLSTKEFQNAFKNEATVLIQNWMKSKRGRLKWLLFPGVVPKPSRDKIYERYLVIDDKVLKIFVQFWPRSLFKTAPHQRPHKTFERLAALIPLNGKIVRERYQILPISASEGPKSSARHRDRVELKSLVTEELQNNQVNWISDSQEEGYDLVNLSEKDVIMIKISIDRLDTVSTFVPEENSPEIDSPEKHPTFTVKRLPTDDPRIPLKTQLESQIQSTVPLEWLRDILTTLDAEFPEIYTNRGKILANRKDALKYLKDMTPVVNLTYAGSYYLRPKFQLKKALSEDFPDFHASPFAERERQAS
jgi:hypothetical protein